MCLLSLSISRPSLCVCPARLMCVPISRSKSSKNARSNPKKTRPKSSSNQRSVWTRRRRQWIDPRVEPEHLWVPPVATKHFPEFRSWFLLRPSPSSSHCCFSLIWTGPHQGETTVATTESTTTKGTTTATRTETLISRQTCRVRRCHHGASKPRPKPSRPSRFHPRPCPHPRLPRRRRLRRTATTPTSSSKPPPPPCNNPKQRPRRRHRPWKHPGTLRRPRSCWTAGTMTTSWSP